MSAPRRSHLLLLLLAIVGGCGASTRATPFVPGKHAPRPADAPVRMFSTRIPACEYEELGLLRAEARTGLTPWQRVVDAFLARAREMGGDGVIVKQGRELRSASEGEVVADDVLSGTVIRFTGPGCEA